MTTPTVPLPRAIAASYRAARRRQPRLHPLLAAVAVFAAVFTLAGLAGLFLA